MNNPPVNVMARRPTIELVSVRRGPPAAYDVAGVVLVTDIAEPSLAAFARPGAVPRLPAFAMGPAAVASEAFIFDDDGRIGDGQRRVVCRSGVAGYTLAIDGLATYRISPDGGHIQEVEVEPDVPADLPAAVALGAPLVLALALSGRFCLHASVVVAQGGEAGDRLIAFIGESGMGKSTLARYLDGDSAAAWRRVIDDTLPLYIEDTGRAVALPHFPQLKLPAEAQPVALTPPVMPLAAVYVLQYPPPGSDAVTITPLSRREATLALVADTVGSRLFDRELLARQLAFGDAFAAQTPVKVLAYPRRLEMLPTVAAALAADLLAG